MDVAWKISVFLALLATGNTEVNAKQCESSEIVKCQKDNGVTGFFDKIGAEIHIHYDVIIESQWLFTLQLKNLTDFCGLWPHYESCLQGNVIPGCDDVGVALLTGMDRSIQHLCEIVQAINMGQADGTVTACLAEASVWEDMKPCMHDFVNDTTGEIIDRELVCEHSTKDVKYCINRAVNRKCGFETMEWFSAYLRTAYKPVLDVYKCEAWPLWLVVCLNIIIAVVLLAIILGCSIYCYRKIRRSNIKTLESDVTMTQTSYRQLRQPRSPRVRNEVTALDAAQPGEGTELVSINDRRQLMSNQIC